MPLELSGLDLTTEVVRTERLVLRPARQDDVDDVLQACLDPEAQRWLPIPVPYTRDDAVAFVAERNEGRAEGRGLLCVTEADGRLVGSAGLHISESLLGPGVGYWWKDPRAPQPSQARAGTLHGGRRK